MKEKLLVPQIGESVSEAQISKWLVQNGEYVAKDQDIVEIDSDKTTLTVSASESGKIEFLVDEGSVVKIGQLIAEIDTAVKPDKNAEIIQPIQEVVSTENNPVVQSNEGSIKQNEADIYRAISVSPLAKNKMHAENIRPGDVFEHVLKLRIGVSDVDNFIAHNSKNQNNPIQIHFERKAERKPMSPLRKKLAQRLVTVKNQTAMLTTFNEIDMSRLMDLRNRYKDEFHKKHGVKLGFMSFFAGACSLALQKFPSVNGMIDGDDVVYYNYSDISIAVSTEKGLMVPVIRGVNEKSIPDIERAIAVIAEKARTFKLIPEDFEGGTFTITNGGVFGSMLSTPIINPPQTAILGMHAIQDRPVAISGRVEIRPMMYVALSYDHRLIDGKESVGFLIEVKRLLENPEFIYLDGSDSYRHLLDL